MGRAGDGEGGRKAANGAGAGGSGWGLGLLGGWCLGLNGKINIYVVIHLQFELSDLRNYVYSVETDCPKSGVKLREK